MNSPVKEKAEMFRHKIWCAALRAGPCTCQDDRLRDYLASIGSKGGKATGKSKVRGDADYYKRISKKAAEARKRKAAMPSP